MLEQTPQQVGVRIEETINSGGSVTVNRVNDTVDVRTDEVVDARDISQQVQKIF